MGLSPLRRLRKKAIICSRLHAIHLALMPNQFNMGHKTPPRQYYKFFKAPNLRTKSMSDSDQGAEFLPSSENLMSQVGLEKFNFQVQNTSRKNTSEEKTRALKNVQGVMNDALSISVLEGKKSRQTKLTWKNGLEVFLISSLLHCKLLSISTSGKTIVRGYELKLLLTPQLESWTGYFTRWKD